MPAVAAKALEQMARARFGNLSPAELTLVRMAPYRNLAWAGPSDDPNDPSNDPSKAAAWSPDRTIRAPIIVWLLTDPQASINVHPSGIGIAGARITGELDLSYRNATLPLTILSCAIADGIEFSFARLQELDLRRSWTGSIDGEQGVLRGDLTLRLGTYQDLNLYRSEIGGTVDLSGARLAGADPFSAVEATIHGDVLFHEGFTTGGLIDFRLARIGNSVSFNHAIFTGTGDNGFDAERAHIDGALYWVDIKTGPGTQLDLSGAQAGALWDDAASWPAAGNLYLDGFVYSDFTGGTTDPGARLEWLHRQPAGLWTNPQPYRQLAQVLNQQGAREAAIQIQVAKENAMAKYGHLRTADRVWRFIMRVTIGYGYRPLRALWWILLFVVVGAILFSWGYRERLITPTEESAYQTFICTGAPPAHYPPFSGFIYSLENFLPVVDLHQGTYWRPNPRHSRDAERRARKDSQPGVEQAEATAPAARDEQSGTTAGTLLRWYLWLHILAGWTITPLLFAGLSGLLRND